MQLIKKGLNLLPQLYVIGWALYFTVIWMNAIQLRGDGWYAAYLPHWGDGVAHLSYMAAFAYRLVFPLYHPLFIFHPFTYSFAADLIGGLIAKTGIPLWFAYNLWGFGLSIAVVIALWKALRYWTGSNLKTLTASTLFFFSGGIGWKYLIIDKLNPAGIPESPFFPLLYTQREKTDIAWLNVIVGELIPQRAMLLAIPIGLAILYIWYRQFVDRISQPAWLLFLSGILFGLMPVIHPHTTMVLALTIIVWGLPTGIRALKNHSQVVPLLLIALPSLVLGLTLTKIFLVPSVSSGFFKFYPGWLALSKKMNWWLFWFDNWGLFLPLAMIGTIFFTSTKQKTLLLPFWIWFGLANLFLFQPYDWDNSKILTWVYLFFTFPVTQVISHLFRDNFIHKIISAMLMIILTLSGGIDAYHMLDTHTYALQILNKEELALAEEFRQISPAESVVLTSTTHRNWVPIATGRQILCGYLGWMWTYGIDAGQRVTDMRAMYSGTSVASDLLKHYGIDYVVIGPEEEHEFQINENFFDSRFPVVIQNATTKVYQITW